MVFKISRINYYENKPSVADDETAKHCSNSSSGSSYSDCGSSGSDKLGSSVNVPADSTGLETPQCDLGERALWHQSNIALQQEEQDNLNSILTLVFKTFVKHFLFYFINLKT